MAKALGSFNLTSCVSLRRNYSRPSFSSRPKMVTMSMSYNWPSIHKDIESHLNKVVTVKEPAEVYEPIRHLVFAAPVNMAPALCVAACELVGGQRDQAMDAAAALHVLHAASFVHDNLRLSNGHSLVPRCEPLMYHAFKPNIQLLAGDALIPFGLELLAESDDPTRDNSDRILRVMVEITRAIGSAGTIAGTYNELQHSQATQDGRMQYCTELIDSTSEKKEGGLHACGAACGAILGGGSEEEVERLRRYGFYVGMVQGRLKRVGSKKEVEELKNMAVKEIKGFNGAKVEAISTFFEANLSLV